MLNPNSIFSRCRFGMLITAFIMTPALAGAASLDTGVGNDFFGLNNNWLMDPSLLKTGSRSNTEALAEVGRLFRTNNSQAPLALKNYIDRHPKDPAAFDLAGVVLMQQREYSDAVVSFRKGISLDPNNPWLWAKLGAALALDKRDASAMQTFERALQLDPENPLALRHASQYAVKAGDLIKATQHSERALKAFGIPGNTINQAHLDLAELYLRLNRHRDGLELLRPAVDNPNLDIPEANKLELYGRYMDMAMAAGDATSARGAYDKLTKLVDPNNPQVKLTEARILRMEGNYIESLAMIEGVSAVYPNIAPQLLPDKAITLAASGQHTQAAAIWRDLANSAAKGTSLPYLREALSASVAAGEADAVAAEVQTLSSDHPDRADYAMLELEFLGKTGRSESALKRAKVLSRAFPKDAEIHRMLGILASASGDSEAAREALETSLAINPQAPQTWLILAGATHGHGSYVGTGHNDNGGHDDVEALLKRAIAANPASSDLHAELGLMYLSDGRVPEAITSFDTAVENNPIHMAGLALGALARADAEDDLGTALALIDRARVMAPDDEVNKDIMGWVLARQGNLERGVPMLEEAALAEPDDVTIQYHLGVAKEMMGNTSAASEHYLAALGAANYDHNVADTRTRYLKLNENNSTVVNVMLLDEDAADREVGTISIESSPNGIVFMAAMAGLTEGPYSAHVHEFANCGGGDGALGSLAGAHYGHAGHDMTKKMKAGTEPKDDAADAKMEIAAMKPKGDLPPFVFDASGVSATVFTHEPLTLDEIRGRAIMLHLGMDKEGVSGTKVACGIIP